MPSRPPLLAFRSADDWAERLLRHECDVVLLAHAGLAADAQTAQPPGLSSEQESGVELIALGQRPLLLLHHSGNSDCAAALDGAVRPPQGYLLPPATHSPLLLQALATGSQLPVQHCAVAEPQIWLQQLVDHCLLLPAHLTLLTISPWREAGLLPLQPLQPLCESLWLLLRCGDSAHPEISALLQWWGGTGPINQRFSRPASVRKRHWWPWWPGIGL